MIAQCRLLGRSFVVRHGLLCSSQSVTGEARLAIVLRERFVDSVVEVKDISGGCGAMYEVFVRSAEFRDKPLVKQHQMVTAALKKDIKEMHGIRINTEVPTKES